MTSWLVSCPALIFLVLRSSRVLSAYSLCCAEFFSLSGYDASYHLSLSAPLPPSLPFLGLFLVYVGFLNAISFALFFHEGTSCCVLSSFVSMRLLFFLAAHIVCLSLAVLLYHSSPSPSLL